MTATLAPTTHASLTGRAAQPLAGLATMIRFVIRRNRALLVIWPALIVGMFAYVTAYYRDLLNTQQALDDFAMVTNTASIKALTGLAAEPATLGGAVWTKIWMTSALMLGFAAIFLVTRTGRGDEEAGRTELLRSRVLGLQAYSVATWIVVGGMCVVTGVGVAVASISGGLDPMGEGVAGSLIIGASLTGVGWVAMAVSAVTGQIASTSRAANATASAVVAVMYVLRMVGDLGTPGLTWASPIGWGQQMQPWGANRWWPLALSLVLTVALLAVAAVLQDRRDLGLGLLPQRHGHPDAPPRWATPLGLALHLERNVIVGWMVAVVFSGLLFGSVVPSMTKLVDDAAGPLADVLVGTGTTALLSLLVTMIALIAAIFAVQTTVTMRQQEVSGLIEHQLAGAVSRPAWVWQRFMIPAVGSGIMLVLGGLALGVGYMSAGGENLTGKLVGAAVAYWPAVMVLAGVAVFLFGWLPHLAIAGSWAVIGAMWVLVIAGDALGLPQAVLDAMPLAATPAQPMEALSWPPLIVMTLIAGVLLTTGVERFRRRDLVTG